MASLGWFAVELWWPCMRSLSRRASMAQALSEKFSKIFCPCAARASDALCVDVRRQGYLDLPHPPPSTQRGTQRRTRHTQVDPRRSGGRLPAGYATRSLRGAGLALALALRVTAALRAASLRLALAAAAWSTLAGARLLARCSLASHSATSAAP